MTDLNADGAGVTYGVGLVPGTQNLTRVGYAGWTLAAIVDNPSEFPEPHQVTLWGGWVPTDLDETPPATEVDGFCYPSPSVGDPNPGRLLVTAAEGDALIFGDFMYFGRTDEFTSTNLMWGPGNYFFMVYAGKGELSGQRLSPATVALVAVR